MTIVIALLAGTLLFSAWILYDWAEIRFWLAARVARWLDAWEDTND